MHQAHQRAMVALRRLLTSDFRHPGLERTDNGMKQSSWPDVMPINQKNYYT